MVQMISRIDGANDYERHPPSTGEPQVKGRISLLHHTQTKNEFIFFNSLPHTHIMHMSHARKFRLTVVCETPTCAET